MYFFRIIWTNSFNSIIIISSKSFSFGIFPGNTLKIPQEILLGAFTDVSQGIPSKISSKEHFFLRDSNILSDIFFSEIPLEFYLRNIDFFQELFQKLLMKFLQQFLHVFHYIYRDSLRYILENLSRRLIHLSSGIFSEMLSVILQELLRRHS